MLGNASFAEGKRNGYRIPGEVVADDLSCRESSCLFEGGDLEMLSL